MRKVWQIFFFFFLFIAARNLQAAPIGNTIGIDSIATTYHENGEIKEKQKFKNGEKHGRWITYDEKGAITKIVKYKKGKFWWERLYKKGKLSQITDRKGKVTKMKDCGC